MSSKLKTQAGTAVMGRVPFEIIFAIGLYLDAPSIFAAIQLSHNWFQSLRPLLWRDISDYQWHHPSFPIEQPYIPFQKAPVYTTCSLASDLALAPLLLHTTSLSWSYNHRIMADYRPHILLRHQIPQERLAKIISLTINLVDLSLRMDVKEYGPEFLRSLLELTKLKRLSMVAPSRGPAFSLKIEPLLPVFARLDELELIGGWTERKYDRWQAHSEGNVRPTKDKEQLLNQGKPWKVERFKFDSVGLIDILRFCTELVVLEFKRSPSLLRMYKGSWETILEYLYSMPQLTTVILGNIRMEESEVQRSERLAGGRRGVDWVERGHLLAEFSCSDF
ncbi:hypothetical protein BGZ97_001789 [Linnemannia gamsii]|uniref:F-box domain-containing protein n=1 Tax=Linnemannia gamsii TaxID=64522 RepID=A0A9P6UHV1_9FUNG|nr:hypothetical protein BGZ97_001789 [Linnemannia gamsii]